ncbi:hypothetical protein MCEMRE26_01025 [Candidatus Nanopelagicaceae bacterium]
MRKVHRNVEEEDATSMGGWLFADSFLALMVIFLATISFVPALGGSISSAGNVGNIAGNNYVKGLNLVYESFDAALIESDIAQYSKLEGMSPKSAVLYAKIIGGYNPATEIADDGRFKALMFSLRMKKAGLTQFENTKIDLGASDALKPDQIVLRLTLSGS